MHLAGPGDCQKNQNMNCPSALKLCLTAVKNDVTEARDSRNAQAITTTIATSATTHAARKTDNGYGMAHDVAKTIPAPKST
jgi:hypothetical protein